MSGEAIAPEHSNQKRTLASTVYDRLREDILQCVLKPGERLRLHQLAEQYACGVGALREALNRLVGDGLVVSEEQRGFAVSIVSREHLLDLLQMRLLLEEEGIRRSIELGGVEWEVEVMSAFHRLCKVNERNPDDPRLLDREWERHHAAFHRSLVGGCQSPLLLQIRDAVYARGDRYRHLYRAYLVGKRDHLSEHRALMEAALRRDANKTVRLIRQHLQRTVDGLLAHDAEQMASRGRPRGGAKRGTSRR
jgi:GntR family carbon starvation induced transcriptional regulator